MQADILTTVILPTSLFIIMLGLGLSLRTEDFTRVIKQPKAAFIGLCAQVVALPFIALLVAVLFKLPPELAVGLMIISFAPGGATSNLFTNLAKGDVALSISLTAVTSLITPFTLPLFTVLAMNYFMGNGEAFELPVLKIIMQLIAISVVPVMIGMLVLSKWQKAAKKADAVIRVFSIIFLFLIIAAIILDNKTQMADFFLATGLATLTLNILVLALGYGLGQFFKLPRAQAVSIGYEVGMQNGTLALLVAGTLIGNSTMMIPAVTYSILMFFTGFLFGVILKKLSSDESRL
ncbi:MAG: bile acid:sodium symporter [Cycloclasticus sp.]|nr:bile acid:sodium symporter [Cycloclasticus sp.]MBG95416.1 bile acid:sodium symporter [Cycloclasticus sp.]HAI96990.1 bile acid:sodium symporter [Methylococcaceae bacterium]|tara:strand:+ start:467 stop:1342 length:876 start_codon:yes stop_codon:yes gene_type:complete